MTSQHSDKRFEFAQFTAPKHDHAHSVYVRCADCLLFGIPMPGEYQCGNCNSHNTASYVGSCCVEAIVSKARREALEEAAKVADQFGNEHRSWEGRGVALQIRNLAKGG